MAHTKAQGAANRTINMAGKRLGLKCGAGQFVNAGTIIMRQRGSKFHPGIHAGMGKDYTIFAKAEGYVSFRNMTGIHRGQKYIDILETIKKEKKSSKGIKSNTTAKTPIKK